VDAMDAATGKIQFRSQETGEAATAK